MTQTDNPNPKMKLPESWAEKMSCPVCGERPLGVFHPTGHADRFACSSCETSFELEDGGKRLRFVTLPQGITPWMRGQWVVLEEAMAAFEVFKNEQASEQQEKQPEQEEAPSAEPRALTPEEIRMRPPVKTEMEERAEFEARAKEDMGEYMDASLLYAADKPDAKTSAPLPFYEEDFAPGGQPVEPEKPVTPVTPESTRKLEPEQKTVPVTELAKPPEMQPEPASPPRPKVKSDGDIWKDEEIKRVKDALTNPPKGDFAGHLASAEPGNQPVITPKQEQASVKPVEEEKKAKVMASAVVPTVPVQPRQAVWSPEVSTATREPVKMPPGEIKKPQPKPVEQKPPVISETPSMVSAKVPSPAEKDMEAIRTNITSGTMLTQTVDERIQDAMERAVELQRLGNTDQEVRSILERSSGLTPDEVAQVMKSLDVPEVRKGNNRLLLIFLAAALLIFAILAWWFFSNQSATTPGQGTPDTEETGSTGLLPGSLIEAASLPAPLQTLVPNGLRLMNDPPLVEPSTEARLPAANCPRSQAAAATLFGGEAKEWSQDSANNGWMMMTTRQSAEVKIPANMNGGYLVFERGPEMRGVNGPAIVKNIYMISVSCE